MDQADEAAEAARQEQVRRKKLLQQQQQQQRKRELLRQKAEEEERKQKKARTTDDSSDDDSDSEESEGADPMAVEKEKKKEKTAAATQKKKKEEEAAAAARKKKEEEEAAAAAAAAAAILKKQEEEEAARKKQEEEEAAARKKKEEEEAASKKLVEDAEKKAREAEIRVRMEEEWKKKKEAESYAAQKEQSDQYYWRNVLTEEKMSRAKVVMGTIANEHTILCELKLDGQTMNWRPPVYALEVASAGIGRVPIGENDTAEDIERKREDPEAWRKSIIGNWKFLKSHIERFPGLQTEHAEYCKTIQYFIEEKIIPQFLNPQIVSGKINFFQKIAAHLKDEYHVTVGTVIPDEYVPQALKFVRSQAHVPNKKAEGDDPGDSECPYGTMALTFKSFRPMPGMKKKQKSSKKKSKKSKKKKRSADSDSDDSDSEADSVPSSAPTSSTAATPLMKSRNIDDTRVDVDGTLLLKASVAPRSFGLSKAETDVVVRNMMVKKYEPDVLEFYAPAGPGKPRKKLTKELGQENGVLKISQPSAQLFEKKCLFQPDLITLKLQILNQNNNVYPDVKFQFAMGCRSVTLYAHGQPNEMVANIPDDGMAAAFADEYV